VRVQVVNNFGRNLTATWYHTNGSPVGSSVIANGQKADNGNGDSWMSTDIRIEGVLDLWVYYQNLKVGPTRAYAWHGDSQNYLEQWYFQGDSDEATVRDTHVHVKLTRLTDTSDWVYLQVTITAV
jgi:hypothetical protein